MTFSVRKLSFDMELEKRDEDSGKIREYPYVHKKIIGLMQQREYSIDRRIENIGRELSGCTDPVPAISLLPENKDADIQVLPELIEWCGREYPTLSPFADRVKSTFGEMSPEERKRKTEFLLARLKKTFPGIDLFFEQLMVNDMMFMYSPYTDGRLPVSYEYEALKIIHGMLCLLTACNTDENSTEKELTDVCVFFFRAVEFTAFRYNMFVLNGSAGNDNNDDNDNNNDDDDNGNAA